MSQEVFIDSILTRFKLTNTAPTTIPLTLGTQLTKADCVTSQADKDEMAKVLYRELVGALSWLTLRTRPNIVFMTSSLSRFGLLKYCIPYRNHTHSGGQSIARHKSDVVGSNSYDIM